MTSQPSVPTLDHPTFKKLKAAFPGTKFRATEFRGQSTLVVEPKHLHAVMKYLRAEGYDFLSDVVGIDYLNYPAKIVGCGGDRLSELSREDARAVRGGVHPVQLLQ